MKPEEMTLKSKIMIYKIDRKWRKLRIIISYIYTDYEKSHIRGQTLDIRTTITKILRGKK